MLPSHADIVVIGGGSCGSVVAAVASAEPDRTVVLLEAGPGYRSERDMPADLRRASVVPVGPGSPWIDTVPVRLTEQRSGTIARGRVLGGSGAVNGAYFVRARPDDFADWPDTWSYEAVLPHFRAIETDIDFGGDVHGAAGPVPVTRVPWDEMHPVAAAFHDAATAAGFAAVADLNAPGPHGVGRVPSNVRDGMRIGPAEAFLLPVTERPGLTVAAGTTALDVMITDGRATGVRVADGTGIHTIGAGCVVLCAGAVRSPHLLMLSGIGAARDLRALGLPVVHDLPGVGRNATDHPEATLRYRYRYRSDPQRAGQLLETVLHTDTVELRPYTAPFGTVIPGSGVVDPVLGVVLTTPRSHGNLVLDPADPRSAPTVHYRYLEDPADRNDLAEGLQTATDLLAAMTDIVDPGSIGPAAEAHLGTSLHLSGTCRMGSDDRAVVDDRCRVRGIDGLSVVDTSVFPRVPSRGPHATAVTLAHRVAAQFGSGV